MSEVAREIWRIFNDASFYVLLGLFIAGLIQIFINKEKVAKHLGARGFAPLVLASLAGIPLPLCSCSVIPTALSLRKSGASRAATLSFLISTPESGPDSIAVSYAMLDPVMTVFRPVSAFITALIAGTAERVFGKREDDTIKNGAGLCMFCDDKAKHTHRLSEKLSYGMRYAFVDLLGDIAKWFIAGIVLAGVISYLIPESLIEEYLGFGFLSMLIMLVIGMPIYICASASTPLVAALIAKGMSPGTALVFLLVGPATNVAGMLVLGRALGGRTLLIYLLSISLSAMALGSLLNNLYIFYSIDIKTTVGMAGEILPSYMKTLSSLGLILLMILGMSSHRRTCDENI